MIQSQDQTTIHFPSTRDFFTVDERHLLAKRKTAVHTRLTGKTGLRDCQVLAINSLEKSFKNNRPKALIQMATGAGKTFTAITFIYRLLKYAKAKRVLFLVDTRNLGEQAEQEFMAFVPNNDNRKFTELYGVTRLRSGFIPTDNQVYISTIQRMYSILQGKELDESLEETNPNELQIKIPGFYQSRGVRGVVTTRSSGFIDIAIKKKLLARKGAFVLR